MNTPSDVADRLLDTALNLAASTGWRGLSLRQIAMAAEVPLDQAYAVIPSRYALLAALLERIDRKVLAGGTADTNEPVRDRLFEILMRRFDALSEHKKGIAALLTDLPAMPGEVLLVLPRIANSMAWMLEAAAVPSQGIAGLVRIHGLAAIYLLVLRTWINDDSPDMAATMAALDRALRRADSLVGGCPFRALAPRHGERTDGEGLGTKVESPVEPAPSEGPAPSL
jgi:AcrR family transcriptional regulator